MSLTPLKKFTGIERQLLGLFGVDVGNHDTKSRHCDFVSGFKESKVANQLAKEYVEMEKSKADGTMEKVYYTFCENPFYYTNDKTQGESMFILTLMAIAKEAIARGICISDNEDIALAIGMPPGMFTKDTIEDYRRYYESRGKGVSFVYKSIPFKFNVSNVTVSAQCWGAAMQFSHLTKGIKDVYLVDIGGITTDKLRLRANVIVEDSVESYDEGVNKMFSDIANLLKKETKIRFTPNDIKTALMGESDISSEHIERIKEKAYEWVRDIFTRMITEGAEFRLTRVVTLGGGGILLDEAIDKVASELAFLERLKISDNKANACGYEVLAALGLYGIKPNDIKAFWGSFNSQNGFVNTENKE